MTVFASKDALERCASKKCRPNWTNARFAYLVAALIIVIVQDTASDLNEIIGGLDAQVLGLELEIGAEVTRRQQIEVCVCSSSPECFCFIFVINCLGASVSL